MGANSARTNNSVHRQELEDLEDKSMDANGAKLKEFNRLAAKFCLHIREN